MIYDQLRGAISAVCQSSGKKSRYRQANADFHFNTVRTFTSCRPDVPSGFGLNRVSIALLNVCSFGVKKDTGQDAKIS